MDFVMDLPLTPRGHDAFVVFVCRLTKLVRVAPTTKTVTSAGVAKLFYDNVYRNGAWPEEIVSDRDPRFTAESWQTLAALTGTKLTMSTADHPQTDGQAENSNKHILTALRHYATSFQDDWDEHLTAAEFCHNEAIHASTGFSPFFLTYGYHPTTPAALAADAPSLRPTNQDDFVTHIRSLHQRARLALATAQAKQTVFANRHRHHTTLAVGSYAWVTADFLDPPRASGARRKLGPKFFGPYKVLEARSDVTYKLELPAHSQRHPVVHISHLKPHAGDDPLTFRHPPAPELIDGEEHFYVEAFLDSRGSASRRKYLVKWVGYPDDHNKWISASRLRTDLDDETYQHMVTSLDSRKRRRPAGATA
jgi:hypothetical protein